VNGANLLTITGGHTLDALCYCLGEFHELAAFVVSQRDRIPLEVTGEMIPKTSADQLVVNGLVGNGAVVSFQVRGGMRRGTEFLFEIHGKEGDLQLTATSRASMQRQELKLKGLGERARHSPICQFLANIAGCRKECRRNLPTMSRSSM
jgi:predicted dehydrogenase